MVFNLFKKKKDDDFSDFNSSNDGINNFGLESPNLGLPLDSGIADTNHSSGLPNNDIFADGSKQNSQPIHSFDRLNSFTEAQSGFNNPPQMQAQQASQVNDRILSFEKDIQLINAKLDSIKSFMDSMTQRLMHIERLMDHPPEKEETIRW
jgi:hypothetical protein